jgi:AAA ATPase domain
VQDRQPPLGVFVGRAGERARVAAAGQPWLVAIEGDPGLGKTTLARRCLAETAGLRVLQARASQAETDLEFGLADQLLRAAGSPADLVNPGSGTTTDVSSFAVGARLLTVIGEQAAAGPVAIFVDDLQWADRTSVEALTFMLRRLSVDPVLAIVTYRGPADRLDDTARRMLSGVENQLHLQLNGLAPDEVASLADALGTGSLEEGVVARLHADTGGHPLYLRTLLAAGSGFDPHAAGRPVLPRSLAAAVGEHLAALPAESRAIL